MVIAMEYGAIELVTPVVRAVALSLCPVVASVAGLFTKQPTEEAEI